MDWETYRGIYHGYEISVNQTRILAIVAGEVLREFPRRIPGELREPVGTRLGEFVRALETAIDRLSGSTGEAESETIQVKPADSDEAEIHGELARAVLQLYIAEVMLGGSVSQPDFARLVYSQELVMVFAHLDAFMADSLRSVCQVRPEVLRTDRRIQWAEVLSYGGWEELLGHLAERCVFEFGWQPVYRRVEFLNEEMGLGLGGDAYDLKLLDEAENVRHVLIHNGGRASQEFIARTGRSDVAVGELVPVTSEYVAKVSDSSRLLAGELFVQVSKKFFHVDDSRISGVVRPGGLESGEKNGAER